MVLWFNFKPYLFNPSRIFKTEAMEVVLRLVQRVYFFDSPVE